MTPSEETRSNWLRQFEELAEVNLGRPLELRDYLCLLDLGFDPDAQMHAILSLLKHHGELAEETGDEIRRREVFAKKCKGLRKEFAEDGRCEMVEYSIYQDAAHSIAAVAMLAPLFEATFTQYFDAIRREYYKEQTATCKRSRWQVADQQAWDCHYVFSSGQRRKDLAKGILQLSEDIGLKEYLSSNSQMVLEALFAYRNKMLHCGFEWPIDESKKFAKRIVDSDWPSNWFLQSTRGNETWMFYMSDEFLDACKLFFQGVLDGFSELIKRLLGEARG